MEFAERERSIISQFWAAVRHFVDAFQVIAWMSALLVAHHSVIYRFVAGAIGAGVIGAGVIGDGDIVAVVVATIATVATTVAIVATILSSLDGDGVDHGSDEGEWEEFAEHFVVRVLF